MAHLHVHTLPDGTETSAAVIDPDNDMLHWHTIGGEPTSTDEFGAGHTHTFEGAETSGPIDRDIQKGNDMAQQEVKHLGGNVIEVKEVDRNGVKVGIIAGYIATFDIDRGQDKFLPGAFLESIKDHKRDDRQVRLKDNHGRTIGGFPIETVREDSKGLFGIGEINLEVQQGKELFALARQGVISDFSIGFTSLDDEMVNGVRVIAKAIVWEGSATDEPMNPEARITEVKSVVPFQDLPLASRETPWDSDEAINRVRELTNSVDEPSATYRNAFLWYDKEDADNFGAYKLPISDVINGKLTAIPRGIFAAAAALQGGRGGVDIPEADMPAVIRHVERYYSKMGIDSPFGDDQKQFFGADDVKGWTVRDVEKFFRDTGMMSKNASKALAGRLDVKAKPVDNDFDKKEARDLIEELKSLKNKISG